jgi:hypothetical protein
MVMGACLLMGDAADGQLRAVPKGRIPAVAEPAKPQAEQPAPSRYDRLLVKYLAGIDEAARLNEQQRIGMYRWHLERWRRTEQELFQDESAALDKLRALAKAQGGKLFRSEGGGEELRYLISTSAASARVFTALCRENLVDGEELLPFLRGGGPILDRAWIPLLQNLAGAARKRTDAWRYGVEALYRAGLAREECRPLLTEIAERDSDVKALHALLFDSDPETGRPVPVISLSNLMLAKKLSAKEFSPEVRVVCASYAAALRDYDLAQSVCKDLLSQRYKGFDEPKAPPPAEDRPLFRARNTALYLMFYQLKNERMFKLIYYRSLELQKEQNDHPGKAPGTWGGFSASVTGQAEVNIAQSLVDEAAKFQGESQ